MINMNVMQITIGKKIGLLAKYERQWYETKALQKNFTEFGFCDSKNWSRQDLSFLCVARVDWFKSESLKSCGVVEVFVNDKDDHNGQDESSADEERKFHGKFVVIFAASDGCR